MDGKTNKIHEFDPIIYSTSFGSVVEPYFEDDAELDKLKVMDATKVEQLNFSFEIVKLKPSELKFLAKALGTEYKNYRKKKFINKLKNKKQ